MSNKVLIAGLDDDGLAIYVEAMEKEGYAVTAVRRIEQPPQRGASTPVPDLAILPLDPPDMAALDIARELRRLAVPSLFVASVMERELVAQARCEGAFGYLLRPVAPAALVAAVCVALDLADKLRELEASRERLSASQKLSRKISIAIGIYMARYNLTEDQAFNEIRAYARSQRTQMAKLCEEIVEGHSRVHRLLCCIKEHGSVPGPKMSQ